MATADGREPARARRSRAMERTGASGVLAGAPTLGPYASEAPDETLGYAPMSGSGRTTTRYGSEGTFAPSRAAQPFWIGTRRYGPY